MPHVLVIDDNDNNLFVLQYLLNKAGASYTLISDPKQIGEVLQTLKEEIDVVFLDIEMPGIDGFEMMRVLKNILQLRAPIIACTVHYDAMAKARQMGFDGFLAKPLKADQFASQLERILKGESIWDADFS